VVETVGSGIRSARLAFGGLAHKPWRVPQAEEKLAGAAANAKTFDAVATTVLDGARGYGSNDFKIPLTRRTLHAVLAEASRT
jgi:xanthine dehydrogenase YagS FAD-binding subunit